MTLDFKKEFWKNLDVKKFKNQFEQVERTSKGQAVSEDIWNQTVQLIIGQCDLNKESEMLDLCAGNGGLSLPVAKIIKSVVAADISYQLLEVLNENAVKENISNIETVCVDLMHFEFKKKFSHAIFYAALQYFSEKEVIIIFEKVYDALKDGGIFYIGDIPDQRKLWDFANTIEYENDYFYRLKTDQPAIGYWFDQEFLVKLARYTGFSSSKIIQQQKWQSDSRYRFDIIIKK